MPATLNLETAWQAIDAAISDASEFMPSGSNSLAGALRRERRRQVSDDSPALATETRTLTLLRSQAAGLRSEIAALRGELGEAQHAADEMRGAELVEANSHLVVSALNAERAAEAASTELQELTRTSQHDALTNIPNRTLMLDRISSALALARRHGTRAAVLFVDLDRFKEINDSLGHAAGDEVLRLVAQRLSSVLRSTDTVSRHGGDEFVVLLAEVAQGSDAAVVAMKMLSALAQASVVEGNLLHVSASVGIAIYPDDGGDAHALITRADVAMYRSKQCGNGGFHFYGSSVAQDNLTQFRSRGHS